MAGPGLLLSDTGDTSPTGIGTCNVWSCLALFSGCSNSADTSTALGLGEVLEKVTANVKEHVTLKCYFTNNKSFMALMVCLTPD